MPRKTPKEAVKTLEKINHYKWQFLRRNKQYQKDYDDFLKEKKEFWQLNPYASEENYTKWIVGQDDKFHEKWLINTPFDYRKKKANLFQEISSSNDFVVQKCNRISGCKMGDISFQDQQKEVRVPYMLGVCINLDYPKDKILGIFEKTIKAAKDQRKKAEKTHKCKFKVSYRQAQLDLYDEYLKIWDARVKKKGMTWEKIAAALYPGRLEASHLVIERYKACKELVEGGYVDIK